MVVYFNFKINQEEISKTICIQKDLIINTCNGRCILEKKLTQLENRQKQTENNIKEKFELVVYVPISIPQYIVEPITVGYTKKQFASVPTGKYEASLLGVFHPPLI